MSGLIGPGTLILVVGPSGAGKDTLIDLARAELAEPELAGPAAGERFQFPRRIVTRPTSSAEDHDSLSFEEFARIEAAGGFALSWRAHGLAYGLPLSVTLGIATGAAVVCNVSRASIGDARSRYSRVRVVFVDAAPAVRAARIAARGREQLVDSRRENLPLLHGQMHYDAYIDNSAAVATAAEQFIHALRSLAG